VTLFYRVLGQAIDFVLKLEGFWRRRTGDLLEEVRRTLLAMAEGVTEDADEEVSLVVVCTGTRSPGDIEDILERQWVKFWLTACERCTGETDVNQAYRT